MSKTQIEVRIQSNDFNHANEYSQLTANQSDAGAVVTFTGLVRDMNQNNKITGLYLEHYPGMTEKSLHGIIDDANRRWELNRVTIIHRIGELKLAEQIVFVGVTSKHRKAAFEACEFLMDYLKTKAPFWKKEMCSDGDYWVEARESDSKAAQMWEHT